VPLLLRLGSPRHACSSRGGYATVGDRRWRVEETVRSNGCGRLINAHRSIVDGVAAHGRGKAFQLHRGSGAGHDAVVANRGAGGVQ